MLNYSYTLSVFSVKKKKKEIEQKNATNTVRLRELEQCSQKKKTENLTQKCTSQVHYNRKIVHYNYNYNVTYPYRMRIVRIKSRINRWQTSSNNTNLCYYTLLCVRDTLT